jgi:tripartite-type tricarboxylate transporter receptor subunit TctC
VRRPALLRAAALAVICLVAMPAGAAFPDKPVELTVLFGAGSAADLLARKLADLAGKDLGQPVAVVNRTGAGGALGYTYVKGQSRAKDFDAFMARDDREIAALMEQIGLKKQ